MRKLLSFFSEHGFMDWVLPCLWSSVLCVLMLPEFRGNSCSGNSNPDSTIVACFFHLKTVGLITSQTHVIALLGIHGTSCVGSLGGYWHEKPFPCNLSVIPEIKGIHLLQMNILFPYKNPISSPHRIYLLWRIDLTIINPRIFLTFSLKFENK